MASEFKEKRRAPPAADRRREILEVAARLLCAKGYEGTSIQDVADACGLTKAGLYHHVGSKEELLAAVIVRGLDVLEAEVLFPSLHLTEPVERLRLFSDRLLGLLVTALRLPEEAGARRLRRAADAWRHEIVVVFQENASQTGEGGEAIKRRRKRLVRFLEDSFADAVRGGRLTAVDPRVAAHALLGAILWTRRWYRPHGPVTEQSLVRGMQDLFLLQRAHGRKRKTASKGRRPRKPTRS